MDNLTTIKAAERAPDLRATHSLVAKWGDAIGAGSGFVAVPVTLLRMQSKLGLTATDMMVLVNLLAHWWNPQAAVFPRTTTIAQRMNVNERTIQRSMKRLVRLGLAERGADEFGRRTYRFDGLVARLRKDLPMAMRIKGLESLDA